MVNDLYLPDVEDKRVDLRARIFRECEAMLAYMASRGFPASETIKDLIGLLDIGIARRDEIPMADLFSLHGALSEAIKPAIPRTVELIHWDAYTSRYHWLAPVSAIRRLMGWTLFFFLVFLLSVIFVDASEINAGLFATGTPATHALVVTLFLASLAGLGACFSVLYDARKYVVEGTYDPRIGSNYGIRIGLGLVAGLLLSQVLADPQLMQGSPSPEQGANPTWAFGVPILALLGGFASQLVYTVLNKLVDAAGSVFEQERATEIKARERAILVETQERAGREQVQRTIATVELTAELEAASSADERRAVIDRLIRTASGTEAGNGMARNVASVPGLATLEKDSATVALGLKALDLLPAEKAAQARTALERIAAQIQDARSLARTAQSGDLVREAKRIAAELTKADPLVPALAQSLAAFRGPITVSGITPLGLAIALARITASQSGAAYARWKTRILDAAYTPDLLAPEHVDSAAMRAAIERSPDFAAAFEDETENMAALNNLGRQVVSESDEELLERYGDRFTSPEAFERALRSFRRALLDLPVQREIDDDIVADSGAPDAAALVAALDALREDKAAATEVERLFLIASAVRGIDGDVAKLRRALIEAIEAASATDDEEKSG
jgi:hypothetical protein